MDSFVSRENIAFWIRKCVFIKLALKGWHEDERSFFLSHLRHRIVLSKVMSVSRTLGGHREENEVLRDFSLPHKWKKKSFNQKERSKFKSNVWVVYLFSFYFRSRLPDCCLLRRLLQAKAARPCATVGHGWHPEGRVCSWAPWNLRKTWINTNANSSKADLILKLHASGTTNKLLGIFILKCLSNIN